MKIYRALTIFIFIILTVIAIGWDIFVLVVTEDATISAIFQELDHQYPWFGLLLAWAFGLLCGHWFWPMEKLEK